MHDQCRAFDAMICSSTEQRVVYSMRIASGIYIFFYIQSGYDWFLIIYMNINNNNNNNNNN